jgi:hypothetical protein
MAFPRLSSAVEEELRAVMKPRRLPSGVAEAIAAALDHTRGDSRFKQDWAQRRDAVQRLVKAGQTLQIEMRRADAAFRGSPSGRHFVSTRWRTVGPPLDRMCDGLQAWLTLHAPATKRRGNPHDGHRDLRLTVFRILSDAGVALSKDAQGPAAKVLRAVLEEADRRDGKSARPRASFNGSQWGRWVDDYHYIAQLARISNEHGFKAALAWAQIHPWPSAGM